MKNNYELFVDELGSVNIHDKKSEVYVLSGCAVEEFQKEKIKTWADQIKFKYWGNADVIFHSREIGMKIGKFGIFKNKPKLYKEFLEDMFRFLRESQYVLFSVVCDKKVVRKMGWNSIKLIKTTARKLIYHYLTWLFGLQNSSGKIAVESATSEKDRYYLNEFSYFLSPGCKELSVDFRLVQSVLTSISFVTKHNNDIEEQLADMFAYAMKCMYMRESKQETYKVGSYEDKMIRILKQKLFKKPKFAGKKKMKFYQVIKPFCVLDGK